MAKVTRLLLSVLTFVISSVCLMGQEYVTTTFNKGEGVLALMRRYNLDGYPCNLPEFYQINQLTKASPVYLGKSYRLPIQIYKYNGKSIRNTLKNMDLPRARMIEKYNKDLSFQKIKEVYFIQDKQLWVPYHIYHCSNPETENFLTNPFVDENTNQPPPPVVTANPDEVTRYTGRVVNEPLFGAKLAQVQVTDELLKNRIYYIKGGHGGPDPGAMANIDGHVCCEDEYATDVAMRLGRLLISHGATVHFIVTDPDDGIRDDAYLDCDKDEKQSGNHTIPLNQIYRLRDRVRYVNQLYNKYKKQNVIDQRFISIHVDSRSQNVSLDVHFYYYDGSALGMQMAIETQKVFAENTRKAGEVDYTGTVKARDLYVLKYSDPAALFVEIGNIQNVHDQARIIQSKNRQLIAEWLYQGIVNSKS
jgi:N-acetylmuramoyl-L-alanine amidase